MMHYCCSELLKLNQAALCEDPVSAFTSTFVLAHKCLDVQTSCDKY